MSREPPSVAVRAAGGAAWTIGTGVAARALGLAGTLALTYFIARPELGEISDAAVAVALANQLSTLGVGQYYISRLSVDAAVAWHATALHLSLGVFALVYCLVGYAAGRVRELRAPEAPFTPTGVVPLTVSCQRQWMFHRWESFRVTVCVAESYTADSIPTA